MSALRSFHRWLGLFTLVVFLLTGAYMKFVAHPARLTDGAHLMFLSRHIYILGCALVHLALSAYISPLPTRAALTTQWIANSLLSIPSLLLIAAFVAEPVAGRARTFASSFGLYALFAGAILHFVIATVKKTPA